jgi:hypothetical protein
MYVYNCRGAAFLCCGFAQIYGTARYPVNAVAKAQRAGSRRCKAVYSHVFGCAAACVIVVGVCRTARLATRARHRQAQGAAQQNTHGFVVLLPALLSWCVQNGKTRYPVRAIDNLSQGAAQPCTHTV